jgi:hypothetical protein
MTSSWRISVVAVFLLVSGGLTACTTASGLGVGTPTAQASSKPEAGSSPPSATQVASPGAQDTGLPGDLVAGVKSVDLDRACTSVTGGLHEIRMYLGAPIKSLKTNPASQYGPTDPGGFFQTDCTFIATNGNGIRIGYNYKVTNLDVECGPNGTNNKFYTADPSGPGVSSAYTVIPAKAGVLNVSEVVYATCLGDASLDMSTVSSGTLPSVGQARALAAYFVSHKTELDASFDWQWQD